MPRRTDLLSPKFKGWFTRILLPNREVLESKDWKREDAQNDAVTRDAQITFELNWNTSGNPLQGWIVIRLPDNEPLTKIRHGDVIVLQAGWEPDTQGETIALHLTVEGKDIRRSERYDHEAVLYVGDASWHMLTKADGLSWKPGTNASTVFRDLTEAASLKVGKVNPEDEFFYETGFSHFGPLWHGFRQAAQDADSRFYYWNAQTFLMPLQEGRPIDFTLSSDEGFLVEGQEVISIPQDDRIRLVPYQFEIPGIRAKSLLTSRIQPDHQFKLDAPDISKDEVLVRAVRGRYFNDGTKHRVEVDLVPAGSPQNILSGILAIDNAIRNSIENIFQTNVDE